jgi:uncharacterized protein DUF4926
MIQEHDIVVLTHDLVDKGLCRGDVGAVVHIYSGGIAYEVEFVTGEGRTVAVLTLTPDDIRQLQGREILHVRELV